MLQLGLLLNDARAFPRNSCNPWFQSDDAFNKLQVIVCLKIFGIN